MVRPAKKFDREAVSRMWQALMASQAALDDRFALSDDALKRWENDYDQWLRATSRKMLVAVDEGEVCGFITAERWNPPPVYRERPGIYVDELFVDANHRLHGHGRALVDAVRSWAEEVGAREIRAGIVASNEQGCAFWEKVGGGEIARTFALTIDASETARTRSRSGLGFRV